MIEFINFSYQLASNIETLRELNFPNETTILEKTGVRERYLLKDNESLHSLSVQCSNEVLNTFPKDKIDALILVKQTPEYTIPNDACWLQKELDLINAHIAIDLNQGCAGFIYGLSYCYGLIASHQIYTALLVTANNYNQYISKDNKTLRPLFSDAVSATIIQKNNRKKCEFYFYTNTSQLDALYLNNQQINMNGPKMLMTVLKKVPAAINDLLSKSNLEKDKIDLFVFHQASNVVLDNLQRILDIPDDKFYRDNNFPGNTISSTIPIALTKLNRDGSLSSGMKIICIGFGTGFSIAGCMIQL